VVVHPMKGGPRAGASSPPRWSADGPASDRDDDGGGRNRAKAGGTTATECKLIPLVDPDKREGDRPISLLAQP